MPDAHLGTLWVDIIARDSAFTAQMAKVGSKMTALGVAMTKNITLPIAAAGAIGYKAAAEIGKGYMLVARQLGYTGKELDKLMVRFRKVWRDVPEDAEVVAGVLINVEQRFNQTGKAADKMTKKVLDFARILGADPVTASRELGMWFQQNEIRGKKQAKAMDMIAYAAQKSGIPLDRLLSSLNSHSQIMQELGFDYKEQIALFASFEKAGVGAENMSDALRMALASVAEGGFKTGEAGLRSFISKIKKAPTDLKATKVAIDLFGREAGPKLAASIRQGTFDIDKWKEKLEKSDGTIRKTTDATMQLSDRMKMLGKKILGLFEPIGKVFIYAFEDIILPVLERAANYTDRWADSMDKVPRPVLAAIGTVLTLIALVGPLTAILGFLGNFAILKYGQIAMGIAGIYQLVFLKAAALSYAAGISMGVAFGWILLIIVAVAAAIYIVIKNWSKFAKVFQPVMGALAQLWKQLKKTFSELWSILKPMLIPALKKLAIIVGIVLLGAFAGFTMSLILLINILTAVIKVFVGLGKVIWGTSQIMRGFFSGNRSLMAAGVKNIKDGGSEIGAAMKTMVLDSGKQIGQVVEAVAEGTIAMMDDFNKDAAKKGAEGGKASAKAFEDMSASERKKGNKKQIANQIKRNKKLAKETGKGGKQAGKAYRKGFDTEMAKKGAGSKADEATMTAHLHRRQAYWEAYVKLDFDAAKKSLATAERFQKKADRLNGVAHKTSERKFKNHNRRKEGILAAGTRVIENLLKRSLNKQSGIFLLSRRQRLALQKSFQVREQFATRNHHRTLASIFRFFKNKVAALDRLFNTQATNRRKMQNNKNRGATKWHWSRIVFITSMALFGPAGLMSIHILFGIRVLSWLRGLFSSQRGTTRNHWTLTNVLTRLGLARVFLTMRTMILNFGTWLIRVPKMFYNYIMRGANWLYKAGKRLVQRMIKGVKDKIKAIVGAGEKAGKGTRKGYRKGSKGAKKDGKKAGDNIRKGFKKGTKKGKRDGEKAGKQVGKGFKKGAKKGQKKAGSKTAMEFIMGLKRKLGIASPSKAAEKLGEAVSVGFTGGVGWEDLKDLSAKNMGKVTKAMKNKLVEFGKWMKGLPKHWKNLLILNSHYMSEAGISLAKALLGAIKVRLGIKSPSKEFESIGRYMVMGLINGMKQQDLISFMAKHYGGVENFMRHIMNLFMGNIGMGFPAMEEFFGISNVEGLLNTLKEHFQVGMGLELGEFGSIEQNKGIMNKVFEWIKSQVPGGNAAISSLYRQGATVPSGGPSMHASAQALDMTGDMWAIAKLAAQTVMGPKDWTQGLISNEWGEVLWQVAGHYDHVHLGLKAISPFLRGLAGAGIGGGDVWGQVANYFKQNAGWGDNQASELQALHTLLMRESSMNPTNENDSSKAWGLFQFMPFHHGKGKFLPQGKSSTVVEQAVAGLRYLREHSGGRYGGLASKALAYHDIHNSYQGGGAVSATLHSGERVLSQQQNRWFSNLAKPLSALTNAGNVGRLPIELKVAMPTGTTFKIKNLKEGIIEVVDEGIYKQVEKTIAIDEWVEK